MYIWGYTDTYYLILKYITHLGNYGCLPLWLPAYWLVTMVTYTTLWYPALLCKPSTCDYWSLPFTNITNITLYYNNRGWNRPWEFLFFSFFFSSSFCLLFVDFLSSFYLLFIFFLSSFVPSDMSGRTAGTWMNWFKMSFHTSTLFSAKAEFGKSRIRLKPSSAAAAVTPEQQNQPSNSAKAENSSCRATAQQPERNSEKAEFS